MEDEIWKHCLEIAKKMANLLRNECDGSYVGAEDEEKITFEGKKYKIIINAFWEKVKHFDMSIKGVDNDYCKFENCILFQKINQKNNKKLLLFKK